MSSLTDALNTVLANSYAVYLKTQNYHWNVTGARFHSLHNMFEEQYTELAAAIDEIAERIRALGAPALGSFSAYSPLLKIEEASGVENAEEMLAQLGKDQVILSGLCREALTLAQDEGDEATADMMIARIQVHDKARWMLQSSLSM